MTVNGMEPAKIEAIRSFLRSIGTPVSLHDLEIEPTVHNIDTIYNYIRITMNLTKTWMTDRLRTGLEGLLSG